ncbi:MAG: hypothetical protein FJX62_10495 [Alphaproteobacteria bacterium]|nr:hypothetical protein [Alphaproteobacteria bacterium]
MQPHQAPKYNSPKLAAEARAQRRKALFWIVVAIPLLFMFLLFGYSDQAPTALRDAIAAMDRQLGYPILTVLKAIASR